MKNVPLIILSLFLTFLILVLFQIYNPFGLFRNCSLGVDTYGLAPEFRQEPRFSILGFEDVGSFASFLLGAKCVG